MPSTSPAFTRLHLVRKLLEDCLDAAHRDGKWFNPEPWQCLVDLIDVPTIQAECKSESEMNLGYMEKLLEDVQGVIESAQSRREQEAEDRRRTEVATDHAAKVDAEREADNAKYREKEARKAQRRQQREDMGMFGNALFAEQAEAVA